MNEISKAARDSAQQEVLRYNHNQGQHQDKGVYVQAAIDAATAPLHARIAELGGSVSQAKDGVTAFPTTMQEGMTLRDYFAGQVATAFTIDSMADIERIKNGTVSYIDMAKYCYACADAMLAQRSKP